MNILKLFPCLLASFLILICLQPLDASAQWTQLGSDIDGEAANDRSGFANSMPDAFTIGIGAYSNDGNGQDAGQVRVYRWDGSSWQQKGLDIDGEAVADDFGFSISMPDSNTFAAGGRKNDGNGLDAGHVRVFRWNGSNWTQKGNDIDGEAAGDEFGISVDMPDSNMLAIGGRRNDAAGTNAGHVRVFRWTGSAWQQKGLDIDGEAAGDESGFSVSMPDTNTLAIGAYRNDGAGSDAGQVRVYEWSGNSWQQKGSDIDGEAAQDFSGVSVSMANANTLAIGASANDGNGSNSGHVRVYRWNSSNWVQVGADIDGEASQDQSGTSVALPDPNMVAIGATNNAANGPTTGHVRIYRFDGTNWQQKGQDIDGEASLDQFGYSVSMPDTNYLAAGAPNNSGKAQYAGHVRIYSFQLGTALNESTSGGHSSLKIYPNPANGSFFIETDVVGEYLRITDMKGRLIYENIITSENTSLSTADWTAGIYYLHYGDCGMKLVVDK